MANFIETGEVAIDSIVPAKRQREIEKKMILMQDKKFSEIKEAVGGDCTYGEIKLVKAHLKHFASKA